MAAQERTRREIVAESVFEEWVAKPLQEPNGQEIITLSKDELYRGLDCDGILAKPADGKVYEVTAGTLNVRAAPGTSSAIVGSLVTGERVRAVVHNESWLMIVEGAYADRFIAAAWAIPLP